VAQYIGNSHSILNTHDMGQFQKLRIQMPRNIFQTLHPDTVVDFLAKGHASMVATGLEWVNVNCLEHGSVLMFRQSSEIPTMAPDGYGWMDDERRSIASAKGKEFELYERNLGFKADDKHTTIKRTRYRSLDPQYSELNIVHYLQIDQSLAAPVIVHLIREQPAPSNTSQFSQPSNSTAMNPAMMNLQAGPMNPALLYQHQQQQAAHRLQMHKDMLALQQQQQVQQLAQHQAQQKAQQQTRQVHVEEEPIYGDYLDQTPAHQLATDRFKRNLSFMEEIFSPYSVSDITGPSVLPPGIKSNNLEELKEKAKAKDAELEQLRQHHNDDIVSFQAQNVAMWNCINSLNIEDVDVAETTLEVERIVGSELRVRPSMRRHEVIAKGN